MDRQYFLWLAVLLCASASLWASSAAAGSFTVTPIRVALPPDGSPEVVRLRNLTSAVTLVQVKTAAWSISGGTRESEPELDVVAVPPVFELGGDGEQVIRLALRRPFSGETEKAFRLLITEVPRDVARQPGQLALALQLNLPVFVTPDGARAEPVWTLRSGGRAEPELHLANRGSAHVRVEGFELLPEGGGAPVFALQRVAAVLAGAEHSWPVELPADALGKPLTVRAKTNLGPLEAVVGPAGP